jgi:acetoin utilization protein AcuB
VNSAARSFQKILRLLKSHSRGSQRPDGGQAMPPKRVVADIMTANPVTVTPRNAIRTAVNLMREGGFRRLPVVDRGRLVGIITDRDLRRAANSPFVVREQWYDNFILDHIEVGSCMTPNPITVEPGLTVAEVAQVMRNNKIGGLPVVTDGQLVGIVTDTDLLDFLIELLEHTAAPA